MGYLSILKSLLGITDGTKDGILQLLITEAENLILGYCRIEEVPVQLESCVPLIAADLFRRGNYGDTTAAVKSLSEGSSSVTFNVSEAGADILRGYYARLKPYRIWRGRVPSDISANEQGV
jgi:hypothetical protein